MGVVIAAVSGKGGTGKTSFCANVAVSLCALGEKVLLIDADAGLRNLDLVLGMTDQLLFSYSEVVSGKRTLNDAPVPHKIVKNLKVLTAPGGVPGSASEKVTVRDMNTFFAKCRSHFTVTLIDCPAGLGSTAMGLGSLSDLAVVVATPDAASLRGAQAAAIALDNMGQREAKVLLNRVRRRLIRRGLAAGIDASMDEVGLPLLGAVPEDDDVLTCANKGEVLLLSSSGPASRAYMNTARRIQGKRVRLFEGVRGF